jgi:dTMP kinase
VTLEGPEGCGKSTQAQLLADRVRAAGYRCVVTREPGGTALGEAVRRILLNSRDLEPVPAADALLFNAARAQLVAEVIGPARERGEVVICDRFADSTLAYQGYGAGRPLDELRSLQLAAIGNLAPDLTVLIDVPVELGLRRKQSGEITRFEARHDVEFHRRVREGFLALASAESDRWVVIDGSGSLEAIAASIWNAVAGRLGAGGVVRAGTTSGNLAGSSEPNGAPVRMDR